jgi:hypothetical protein
MICCGYSGDSYTLAPEKYWKTTNNNHVVVLKCEQLCDILSLRKSLQNVSRSSFMLVCLTLKKPPRVLGRRRPPGAKCDPTMEMVITNVGFRSFIVKLKYKSTYKRISDLVTEFLHYQITDRRHIGYNIPPAVLHSLKLLKMGKIVARNMSS